MSKPGPKKRAKTSHYIDRIPLEDDFEVIHARSSHLTSRNEPVDSSRSPLKGRTTWTLGNFWAPDDDEELALDDTDDRYNEELMADVFNSRPAPLDSGRPTRKRRTRVRSRISVSTMSLLFQGMVLTRATSKLKGQAPRTLEE